MKLIALTRGLFAMVDDEDYESINQHKWYALSYKGYCRAGRTQNFSGKKFHFTMHRVIARAKKGEIVDHIDLNPLNNQKGNLRICTIAQNAKNRRSKPESTSKYLGVHLSGGGLRKKPKLNGERSRMKTYWRATIVIDGKQKHLGLYKNEEDAAIAYNEAAMKYHGEYANLNKIAP